MTFPSVLDSVATAGAARMGEVSAAVVAAAVLTKSRREKESEFDIGRFHLMKLIAAIVLRNS
jgi:hypothetical protein